MTDQLTPSNKMARGVLMTLALAVTVGSLFFRPGVAPLTPPLVLVAGGVVAVAAGLCLPFLGVSRNAYWGVALAGGLLGWSFLAAIGSLDHFLSRASLTAWVGSVGILFAVQAVVTDRARWRTAAHVLVAGATAECLYALGLLLPNFLHGQMPFPKGNFANQDTFAMICLVALLLATALIDLGRKSETAALVGECAVLLVTLMLTESRAGTVGLVAAYATFAFVLLRHKEKKYRKQLVAIVAVPALLGMLMLGANYLLPSLHRWGQLFQGKNPDDATVRIDVAHYGTLLALRHPLGTGPGTFALAYEEVRPAGSAPSSQWVNVAHDDFVEVAVETGWLGFALWVGLLAYAVYRAARSALQGRLVIESAAAASAVVGVAAFSTLNFAWPVVATQYYWFATIALALSVPTSRKAKRAWPRPVLVAAGCGLAVAGLWATWTGTVMQLALGNAVAARALEHKLEWNRAYKHLDRAIALEPSNATLYRSRAALAQRLAYFNSDPKWLVKAARDYRRAHEASPKNLVVLMQQYKFLVSLQRYKAADRVIHRALTAAPYDNSFRKLAAQLYLLEGKLADSAKQLAFVHIQEGQVSDRQIRDVVAVLEAKQPGRGVALLRKWGDSDDEAYRDLARSIAKDIVKRAIEVKRYSLAESFCVLLSRLEPRDVCVRFERAEIAGLQGKAAVELKGLDTLLTDRTDQATNDCYIQALYRWSELTLARGHLQAAINRVRQYVHDNGWASGPRVLLSRLYQRAGELEQATEVVQAGLDKHGPGPQLLTRMGELYQKRGMPDLARSYYRRALDRKPGDKQLKQLIDERLKQLK